MKASMAQDSYTAAPAPSRRLFVSTLIFLVVAAGVAVWNTAYSVNNLLTTPTVSSDPQMQQQYQMSYESSGVQAFLILNIIFNFTYLIAVCAAVVLVAIRRFNRVWMLIVLVSTWVLFCVALAGLMIANDIAAPEWVGYVPLGVPPFILAGIFGPVAFGLTWRLMRVQRRAAHQQPLQASVGVTVQAKEDPTKTLPV